MSNTAMVRRPETGEVVREGFGTNELARSAETASSAVAAQAQAIVQARFIVAQKNPRDLDEVRVKLLKESKRPGFADVARYHKPIGKGVEGPSIRFAEAAARCMGNIDSNSQAIFDSLEKRIVRITATDLEANIAYSADITIDKTVERSRVPEGQTPLGSRTNSYGKITYLLPATEDDLLNKQNALTSKALRMLLLRIVPGDLVDEAMSVVMLTQQNRDAQDPDGARKKLVDGFMGIGVKPADLKAYMGQDLDSLSPPQMTHLRSLFAAIRDGEATWGEAMAQRGKTDKDAAGAPVAENVKDRVKAKAQGKKDAPAAEAPRPDAPPAASSESRTREPGDDDGDESGAASSLPVT